MIELFFQNGLLIGLHDTPPGRAGHPRMSAPQPISRALYAFQQDTLINTSRITLDPPERDGMIRYVSLWDGGTFRLSIRLKRPQRVTVDNNVIIAPGRLRLALAVS